MFSTPSELEALTKLLNPPKADDEDDYSISQPLSSSEQTQSYSPFSITSKPIAESEKNFSAVITSTRKIENEEHEDGAHHNKEKELIGMNLCEPKYRIVYEQKVTATDVVYVDPFSEFRNGSTLRIEITLPNEQVSSIDVKVKDDNMTLVLKSNKYHLCAALPHKVFSDKYTAKWYKDNDVLQIKLNIKSEFPFNE